MTLTIQFPVLGGLVLDVRQVSGYQNNHGKLLAGELRFFVTPQTLFYSFSFVFYP